VTTDRDQILSEFIDSWNAGRRPDVDEHLARVPEAERAGLLDDITTFMTWAPTPDYDEATLTALRAEPEIAAALAGYRRRSGPLAALLPRWRQRASLSTTELAASLVRTLGLSGDRVPKTRDYLERVEAGELAASGFSPRLLDALATVLHVSRERLQDTRGWSRPPAAATHFRAGDEAAEAVRDDLELMADAMATRSDRGWDEVDELFRGGR
jgi:hypothetical protein